jgi:glycosyltransferase involved in cell wall biosynthesis
VTQVRCAVISFIATGGGVTEAFFNSLTMLRRAGLEPIPVVPAEASYLDRLAGCGAASVRVPGLAYGGKAARPLQLWRLLRAIRQVQPDLILAHNGRFVSGLRRWLRVPVVAVCHGGRPARYLRADRVITVNDPQRQALLSLGYPSGRVDVIDNVVPVDALPPYAPRPWPEAPVIGTLRLLEPAKGLDTLIEAVAILAGRGRRLRARIGGTGSQEANLRALARRRRVDDLVEFAGWVSDKAGFLNGIDLYVLPSREETWGIAIAEAWAAGLPVVSTACEGPLRLIEDRSTGLLAPPDDPAALADAIDRACRDGALTRRLAEAGHRHCAERYTLGVVAPRFSAAVLAALPGGPLSRSAG